MAGKLSANVSTSSWVTASTYLIGTNEAKALSKNIDLNFSC
jgi:hypothetical protein